MNVLDTRKCVIKSCGKKFTVKRSNMGSTIHRPKQAITCSRVCAKKLKNNEERSDK